jgi:hypothetical protein
MSNDRGSSSSNRPARPAAAPQAPSPLFIDWGPALPDSYGRPRILALVRDPRCYFVTWEEGDAVRARDLTSGATEEHAVGRVGGRAFEGLPEHDYEVDLLSGGRVVAVSNRIRLPRLDPATAVDPAWAPTEGQEEVLRALRGALEPVVARETEERGDSGAWRRLILGVPVSRPSRTS